MTDLGLSEQACIEALQGYVDEIQKILDLFDKYGRLKDSGTKQTARAFLKILKDRLRADCKARSPLRGQKAMSEVEKNFFWWAVCEAKEQIRIRSNSNPSQKWIDDLLNAQDTIEDLLNQLK